MSKIVCHLVGHREYSDDVLDGELWMDREYRGGYSMLDFREPCCLRCGEELRAA